MNIAIIGRTHILLETAKLLEKEGHQISGRDYRKVRLGRGSSGRIHSSRES